MAKSYRKRELTKEILQEAEERANSLPIFKGSHRKRQANVVGCIGEIVFEKFLQEKKIPYTDHRDSTERDYLVNGTFSLEVKTKDRTVAPRKDFDNSVPLYNHDHQRPNYYYFISLLRDRAIDDNRIERFQKAFLMGGIDIDTLDRVGRVWKPGDVDPSNGTTFWTACINVSMTQLVSNSDMLDIFSGASSCSNDRTASS